MKTNLKNVFKGKAVIVGVGNTMRGDDGFGPALIERLIRSQPPAPELKGKVKAVYIDAGSAPENYLGKIAKERPETILIVDAVHLGLAPGKYEILKKSDIVNCGLTTHDISANMLVDFLEKQTEADIYLLGVQPENVSFGDGMSEEVKKALIEISELITEAINA